MNSQKQLTDLQRAHIAFNNNQMEVAIALYEEVSRTMPLLADSLKINIQIAKARLQDQGIVIDAPQSEHFTLQKPELLEDYYFNKIVESNLFDPSYYFKNYSHLLENESNFLAHYLAHGVEMSLNPSAEFNTAFYLRNYPDIAEAGVNPFIHYVCNGQAEGREALPKPYKSYYEVAPVEYVPRLPADAPPVKKAVRAICFYLPQFHAIPENDKWWGEGFTEWTNVKPAKPQFEGHYQPHIPHSDIGYYNLLDRNAQAKQIELAKQYGIEGFCYYLYWFSGQRLLEKPLDNMLADPTLDFPFCVCWANENWSRRWDGLDQDLLMVQNYSDEDDIAFISNIAKYLRDPRYITIDGKPLLLVYRPNLFPDMKATTKRWRDWCRENGIGEIYLAYPQSFECVSPIEYDFDAAIEFPPNNSNPPAITSFVEPIVEDFKTTVYDWRAFVERSDAYTDPGYKLFRSATPSWDNTARKKNKGIVFQNSCPKLFKKYLVNAFGETIIGKENPSEDLVFINAWNEWAEGAHLEPDQKYGYAWLNAVKEAHRITSTINTQKVAVIIHAFYPDVLKEILIKLDWAPKNTFHLYITTTIESKISIESELKKFSFKNKIYVFENKGRDVLPFLRILPDVIADGNKFLIKVHTKKSLHRADGDRWREELYSQILSKSGYISSMLKFIEREDVALISPDNNLVPLFFYWGSNSNNVINLAKKAGFTFSTEDDYTFVAGTMFFARTNFFNRDYLLNIDNSEFEEEAGQVDGTLAHALERFFGVMSKHENCKIEEIGLREKKTFCYAKAKSDLVENTK